MLTVCLLLVVSIHILYVVYCILVVVVRYCTRVQCRYRVHVFTIRISPPEFIQYFIVIIRHFTPVLNIYIEKQNIFAEAGILFKI